MTPVPTHPWHEGGVVLDAEPVEGPAGEGIIPAGETAGAGLFPDAGAGVSKMPGEEAPHPMLPDSPERRDAKRPVLPDSPERRDAKRPVLPDSPERQDAKRPGVPEPPPPDAAGSLRTQRAPRTVAA